MHPFAAKSLVGIALFAILSLGLTGCSTAPQTQTGQEDLHANTDTALSNMERTDPSLKDVLSRAYGYAVFPKVGKGGLVVGGGYGRGLVYEQGKMVGYCDMSEASFGLQGGGEEYSELIAFETDGALSRFKTGNFGFTADVSAVAVTAGSAAHAHFTNGIVVFASAPSGLMVAVSVAGQKFSFLPTENEQK